MSVSGHPAAYYSVDLTVDDTDVRGAGETVLAALAHPPWPPVTSWSSPLRGQPRTDPLLDALRRGDVVQQVRWQHGDALRFSIGELTDHVKISLAVFDTALGHAWRWLVAIEEWLARLLGGGLLIRHGLVLREGTGVACLPSLQLMGRASYMVVADDTALGWAFERPEAVIAEGRWRSQRINDCWILSRAMHAETNVELLEAIQDSQWAMARLCKPGQARYDTVEGPQPEEEAIFLSGPRQVLAVGYDAAARTASFSCAPGPGTHVAGWEILALRRTVNERRLETGQPVDRVDVLFPDRTTATAERRPLLDVGVHVLFYDERGGRAELTS